MKADVLTVGLGILTPEEFGSVSVTEQGSIEDSTVMLRRQYAPSWFKREAARLRRELQFAYGVTLDDAVSRVDDVEVRGESL